MTPERTRIINRANALMATMLVGVLAGGSFGYSLGEDHGRRDAEARHAADKATHDYEMRALGICNWAAQIAKDITCGGTERIIKDHTTCTVDDPEKCS